MPGVALALKFPIAPRAHLAGAFQVRGGEWSHLPSVSDKKEVDEWLLNGCLHHLSGRVIIWTQSYILERHILYRAAQIVLLYILIVWNYALNSIAKCSGWFPNHLSSCLVIAFRGLVF